MAKRNNGKNKPQAATCIIPGCNAPEARRGLCEGCYRAARRKVLDKSGTSWAALESAGLAKPLDRKQTPFKTAYEKHYA